VNKPETRGAQSIPVSRNPALGLRQCPKTSDGPALFNAVSPYKTNQRRTRSSNKTLLPQIKNPNTTQKKKKGITMGMVRAYVKENQDSRGVRPEQDGSIHPPEGARGRNSRRREPGGGPAEGVLVCPPWEKMKTQLVQKKLRAKGLPHSKKEGENKGDKEES